MGYSSNIRVYTNLIPFELIFSEKEEEETVVIPNCECKQKTVSNEMKFCQFCGKETNIKKKKVVVGYTLNGVEKEWIFYDRCIDSELVISGYTDEFEIVLKSDSYLDPVHVEVLTKQDKKFVRMSCTYGNFELNKKNTNFWEMVKKEFPDTPHIHTFYFESEISC